MTPGDSKPHTRGLDLHALAAMPIAETMKALKAAGVSDTVPSAEMPPLRKYRVYVRYEERIEDSDTYWVEARGEDEAYSLAEQKVLDDTDGDIEIIDIKITQEEPLP